jgi:adenylosuccinate lyase
VIPRYTLPEMGAVWSQETKLGHWLRIEVLACEAWAELGRIPSDDLEAIRTRASVDPERVRRIEETTQHDVAAFVLLLAKLEALMAAVRSRALEHRATPCVARTHGVHAEPTTFGHKLAVWAFELERDRERLRRARETVRVGKVSGVVGTYASVDPFVEEHVCRELRLRPAEGATQVIQRDRHAEFVTALAITATTIEKIAVELRHLARTEIREIEEPFEPGQKGSSAMPHKRNPVLCERLTGLARVVRAAVQPALEDVALWHERDISHSSVERVILPDVAIGLDYMLHVAEHVVRRMRVFPDRMRANLEAGGGLAYSQRVLLALIDRGMGRDDAYRLVQEAAAEAWDRGADFRQEVRARADLGDEELAGAFEPRLDHLEGVFARLEKLEVEAS